MRYFEIENKNYPSESTTWIRFGFEVKEKDEKAGMKRRWKILKDHDLYPPEKLAYQCKLPESTYDLVVTKDESQASGACGGAPTATINLKRNGKKWISNVLFGNGDCFERPTISSLAINDGKEGWDVRNMTICVKANQAGVTDTCKYIPETDEAKFIPGDEIKKMKARGASEAEIVEALIPKPVMTMKEVPITQEAIAAYLNQAGSEKTGQP
jgi:hypothetical protein